MKQNATNQNPLLHLRLTIAVLTALLVGLWHLAPVSAQRETATDALTLEEASRLAIAQSPAVRAARKRLEASEASLKGSRAPFTPRAELAPGIGFTNANGLLSQQFDIGGLRSAAYSRVEGERNAEHANLDVARLRAVGEVRAAYFDLVRARLAESSAAELARLANDLKASVQKRVEIGEAPAVQAIRAEIEAARAEQELLRARADAEARLAILNRLLGRPRAQPTTLGSPLILPELPPSVDAQVETAVQNRPDVAAALALLASRQGAVAEARAQTRPTLFAALTSDAWSLDHYTSSRRTSAGNVPLFGAQVRFNFPLGRDGAQQAEIARARAAVEEQEAQIEAIRRAVAMEMEQVVADLVAARTIALRYQETILPKAEELARATRGGYDRGLSPFLEVIEAQRVLRQTQIEYQTALFNAVRARIALDSALGILPKEVQP